MIRGVCTNPTRHPWASLGAPLVKNPPAMPETEFNPWVGKFPWRKKWQPTLVFLPGESHGLRNLAGYSPWGHRELDMTERLTFSVQWAPQPFVE